MAIDNENLEMIEMLISSGVEMKDALLHAINEEFVEAVELLLDHENATHTPGTPHVSSLVKCARILGAVPLNGIDYNQLTAFVRIALAVLGSQRKGNVHS